MPVGAPGELDQLGALDDLDARLLALLSTSPTIGVLGASRVLGVARGTDLMLYVLVVAFFFVTVSTWTRFREQELRYARLARAVALQNAQAPEQDAQR